MLHALVDRRLEPTQVVRALFGQVPQPGAQTVGGDLGGPIGIEKPNDSTPGRAGQLFFGLLPCRLSVGSRRFKEEPTSRGLPKSVEQLTELVGHVSLKDLVRETTDMIERMSIEAALELTGDNRASAAELLGLSRQSLYAKLHRYGLGDLQSEHSDER